MGMEQRLGLVTLGVADLARSRRFHEEGLGWKASGASTGEVAFFQLGGIALAPGGREALAEDARLPAPGPGGAFGGIALAHNVRTREEVDAILARARARAPGGRVLRPGEDTSWGGYTGCFADPDGHLWEVAWNPRFTLRDDGGLRPPS
jgi:uncharacterized protein